MSAPNKREAPHREAVHKNAVSDHNQSRPPEGTSDHPVCKTNGAKRKALCRYSTAKSAFAFAPFGSAALD